MGPFETRISRQANPGRYASVSSALGFAVSLERVSPRTVIASVRLREGASMARGMVLESEIEALMRAATDVLGFEIGARHET